MTLVFLSGVQGSVFSLFLRCFLFLFLFLFFAVYEAFYPCERESCKTLSHNFPNCGKQAVLVWILKPVTGRLWRRPFGTGLGSAADQLGGIWWGGESVE